MVEYLDAEIANEGLSAEASWAAPVPEARIPDYKGIKAIAKYFPQFSGRPYVHQVFPCHLYHPKEPARLIKDVYNGEDPPRLIKKAVDQAKALGCIFRATTMEERAQGFPTHRWEYTDEWRATPFETKFDPANPGTGKTVVKAGEQSSASQAEMIAAVVTAALAKMVPAASTPDKPSPIDDPDMAEFLAFKAWKATQAVDLSVQPLDIEGARNAINEMPMQEGINMLNSALPPGERKTLEAEAERKGIKVDGRWSLQRLKDEVEKAAD